MLLTKRKRNESKSFQATKKSCTENEQTAKVRKEKTVDLIKFMKQKNYWDIIYGYLDIKSLRVLRAVSKEANKLVLPYLYKFTKYLGRTANIFQIKHPVITFFSSRVDRFILTPKPSSLFSVKLSEFLILILSPYLSKVKVIGRFLQDEPEFFSVITMAYLNTDPASYVDLKHWQQLLPGNKVDQNIISSILQKSIARGDNIYHLYFPKWLRVPRWYNNIVEMHYDNYRFNLFCLQNPESWGSTGVLSNSLRVLTSEHFESTASWENYMRQMKERSKDSKIGDFIRQNEPFAKFQPSFAWTGLRSEVTSTPAITQIQKSDVFNLEFEYDAYFVTNSIFNS